MSLDKSKKGVSAPLERRNASEGGGQIELKAKNER